MSTYFEDLSLSEPLLKALQEENYENPTDIQLAAIPELLAGRDLLATAKTGTGKTAAFSLPILDRLNNTRTKKRVGIRCLILTPTRELALQVEDSMRRYGRHLPIKTTVILGGVPQARQIKALKAKPDILVATPGRLIDLRDQGFVRLEKVEMLVLDEADRMLDMGFVRDVRRIVTELSRNRQTMFFSATMSPAVIGLASDLLRDPVEVAVNPPAETADNVTQQVYFVRRTHKLQLLTKILKEHEMERTLVFTRTKYRAERIMRHLAREGVKVDSIHSNKTQKARQNALAAFDRGEIQVLVATDIVARGIDVDGISHVVNYEMPNDPESYVHRIGRTARAGADGIAVSLCDSEEVKMLKEIESLTNDEITTIEDHPFHSELIASLRVNKPASRRPSLRRRSRPRRPVARRVR